MYVNGSNSAHVVRVFSSVRSMLYPLWSRVHPYASYSDSLDDFSPVSVASNPAESDDEPRQNTTCDRWAVLVVSLKGDDPDAYWRTECRRSTIAKRRRGADIVSRTSDADIPVATIPSATAMSIRDTRNIPWKARPTRRPLVAATRRTPAPDPGPPSIWSLLEGLPASPSAVPSAVSFARAPETRPEPAPPMAGPCRDAVSRKQHFRNLKSDIRVYRP